MRKVKKRTAVVTTNWVFPKRILILYLFVLLILLVQFARISLFDVVNGDNLKEIAANRTTVSKELIANRGTIYDSEGNILATNVASYTLIAYLSESRTIDLDKPRHVVDKKMTAEKLSKALNAPYDYIYERLSEDRYQVEFGSYGAKLTELEKIAIENLELPGISFVESTKRFYPNGQFASYIVGYAKEYTRINLKLDEEYDLEKHYNSYYEKYDNVKLYISDEEVVSKNGNKIKGLKVGTTFFKLTIGDSDKPLATGIINVSKNDVSVREDNITEGELGVESKFNDILKGINGSLTYQRDPSGYKIPDTPEERIESVDGKDIYLTIDSGIQRFLESAIKKEVKDWNPEWIIMAAMDAKTGEILGSATSPTFNPNNLSSSMSYQNPLVSYQYEPGSVMKIYTYLCAADTGKYDGNKKYKSGSIEIGKDRVNDWKPSGWGNISYNVGFNYSSNVGSIHVARDYLSPSKLKACLKSFGFGSKTDIELSGELAGNVDFRENIELDWLSVSFGQGLSTTAIQQLQALSIVANDGYMIKPHIIKKVVDKKTKEVTNTEVKKTDRIVSSKAASTVKKLMYDNVQNKSATGHWYYIKDFNIIGKTGTAQIYENGHYLDGDGNYIISFAGMFPYEDPEIILYIAIKKPKTYLSKAIAPYVKEVIENIAKYRNMYSEIEQGKTSIKKYDMPNLIGMDTKSAKEHFDKKGMKLITIGDGDKIVNQFPSENSKIITGDKIFLVTNSSKILMPNMNNWALSDVIRFANLSNLEYKSSGHGYVIKQNIKEGTEIKNKIIEVELKNKSGKE